MEKKIIDLIKKISKRILTFLAYIFIILIITIVILEIMFRIIKPYNLGLADGTISLVYSKKYKIKNFNKQLDDYIYFTKNSLGFRGEEPPKNFKNFLTIIVSGGSTTENARLTDDKTWVYILGKFISNDFNNAWINNAGFAGHSTRAQLLIIKEHILKLKPEIVIILTGINDLGNVERDRYIENIRIPNIVSKTFEILKKNSYLFSFIHYLNEQIICRIVGLGYRLNFNLETLKYLEINNIEKEKIKSIHMDKMNIFKTNLEEIIELLRENRIMPVIVSQSTLCGNVIEEKTKKDLSKIKIGLINGRLYEELLNLYNQEALKIAEQNNILYIDLENRLEKKYEYYFDYIHYTNAGSEKVAQIIYEGLSPLLNKEYNIYKKK